MTHERPPADTDAAGILAKRAPKSPPGGRSSVRGEQQRSIESRIAILEAALAEFAERGFDAASIRSIGDRAGLHFTLVTYHFKNKRKLWEATITHYFEEINDLWQAEMATLQTKDPFELLRHQFHSFLKFSVKYPNFHKALLQENRNNSPRMEWVIRYFVKPIMDATIPNIIKSQKLGDMIDCDAVLLHYLILGSCTSLASMSGELREAANIDSSNEAIISEYWNIIDSIVFKNKNPM